MTIKALVLCCIALSVLGFSLSPKIGLVLALITFGMTLAAAVIAFAFFKTTPLSMFRLSRSARRAGGAR